MPTILIAESDRELRDIYREFMLEHGFDVEITGDGLDCLAKMRRRVPDRLILDLDLPWGGGDGVLALMAENPRLSSVEVVLTASMARRRVLPGLDSVQVVQMLSKSFPLATLLEPFAEKQPCKDASRWKALVVQKMIISHEPRHG